jgi:hypothetical protein
MLIIMFVTIFIGLSLSIRLFDVLSSKSELNTLVVKFVTILTVDVITFWNRLYNLSSDVYDITF